METQTGKTKFEERIEAGEFQNQDELIAMLAKRFLGIETLETRNSDSLDFHDVSVWGVRDALRLAYLAGKTAK